MSTLLTSVGLGLGAGVNAYATLLVFGLISRWKPGLFDRELSGFFASTPVLITLGVLYVIEFLADKIPAVDHVWDAVHTFVRPAAGALVGWAAVSTDMPKGVVVLATIVAGGAALTSHAAKAALRIGSTATTAGAANPVISLVEDVFAVINAILAIFLPWIVLVVVGVLTIFFFVLARRYRKPQTF